VPVSYGGIDEFGWNVLSTADVPDVARHAALPFTGRRFFVRVAPGLIPPAIADRLAQTFAGVGFQSWQEVRDALLDLDLPAEIREDLLALSEAKRPNSITADFHVYGLTDDGLPRGVLFIAPFGIKSRPRDYGETSSSTEDDVSGSLIGRSVTLAQHSADVEGRAEQFAQAAGLSADRVTDLKLAGYLHDLGKADARFQAWLHYGDPLGVCCDDSSDVLAKSGRSLPRLARADSGLPESWRHEAFSVRLAALVPRFAEAKDPELVLWLVGVHHGYGRPFFPHADPLDRVDRQLPAVCDLPTRVPAGPGPQSFGFDWRGCDWPKLFERLRARYGAWGLAHMEAILRLADHRASEDEKETGK
jgi:CRISPR-associated endonuclease/helicase Cas3